MVYFDIYFNSGAANQTHYTVGDNISYIEITDSDSAYFQTGRITTHGIYNQMIGDKVSILVNNQQLFNGYISRIEKSWKGTETIDYQIVGKTYDLWRYVTDDKAIMSGATAYIASSLVHNYCSGLRWGDTDVSKGIELIDYVDLTYMTVGEALQFLNAIDKYKFYVDNDGKVQYYNPGDISPGNIIYINEDDILDMSNLELSDEDIVNDVLIQGGYGFSNYSQFSLNAPYSLVIKSGVRLAQKFKAYGNILSAFNIYLDRTSGSTSPPSLNFSVWSGNNNPVSGSKFEYSDKSIASSFIPYPPRWTGWLYYQNPFLYVTKDSNLWLVSDPFRPDYSNPKVLYNFTFNSNAEGWTLEGGATWKDGGYINLVGGQGMHKSFTDLHQYSAITVKFKSAEKSSGTIYLGVRPTSNASEVQLYPGYGIFNSQLLSGSYYTWHIDPQLIGTNTRIHLYCSEGMGGSQYKTNKITEVTILAYPSWRYFYDPTSTEDGEIQCAITRKKVRYYFNSYGSYGGTWVNLPKFVDSNPSTFAEARSVGAYVVLNGNSCPGTNLGNIYKVIIVIVYEGDNRYQQYSVQPYYNGSNAGTKQTYTFAANGDEYIEFDVTYGTNAPSSWTWNDVKNLDIKFVFEYTPSSYLYLYPHIAYIDVYYETLEWYNHNTDPNIPSGNITLKLGWRETDNIYFRASSQSSINLYGRHFKKVVDESLTSPALMASRASGELCPEPFYKGQIVVDGITNISPSYRLSANIAPLNINQGFEIVSYTHKIDNSGFTTTIDLGDHSFDITKKIKELEKKIQ